MYIYSRNIVANPERYAEAVAFALSIGRTVEGVTGMSVRTYVLHFGGPVTTISWSGRVDSLADLETIKGKLAADPSLVAENEKGRGLFAGSPEDSLFNVVSASLEASPKKYYSLTSAVSAPGKISEAVQFGVAVQQHVSKLTGLQTAFGTSPFGPFGQVGWIAAADSMAQLDSYEAAVSTDSTFQKMVADAGDLFVPASGQNRLIERIG
jgi:hypothetical protein